MVLLSTPSPIALAVAKAWLKKSVGHALRRGADTCGAYLAKCRVSCADRRLTNSHITSFAPKLSLVMYELGYTWDIDMLANSACIHNPIQA